MSTEKLKLAVFISGRGSNLKSILKATEAENFPAKVELVLSNKPDAGGLLFAKEHNIQTITVNHKDFDSREDFDQGLLDALEPHNIDLICLAGFMRILTPVFVSPWEGRMINIHPSLLPKHKGLNTHKRALEAGDTEAGCTVHWVVPEMDSGEIIVQKRVPIEPKDTPDTLATRVLEQEHIAYPEAIKIAAAQIRNSSS